MDKRSPNIRLDHLRLLQDEPDMAGRRTYYFVLLVLAGLGAFGCVITAFGIPVKTAVLVWTGLLSCVFWVWRQTDQVKRWWSVSLLGWILWLLFVVFLFDDVLRGGVRAANLMLKAYGERLNYELPVLSLPGMKRTAKLEWEGECTAFFGVLLFPFCWWLSRMTIKRKSSLGPFCLTAVFLLLPMGFSILPAGWAYGGILLFWCTLALTALPVGGREAVAFRRGRFQANSGAGGGMLLVPMLALACLFLVYRLEPPETYSRPELLDQMRQGVEEGFGLSATMRGGQGNGNNNVELNTLGGRSYTGETMLRVKFDWDGEAEAQKEYLKSFVGSVYTGTSWERLGAEDSGALRDLELQAQSLPARYRRDMYVNSIDQEGSFHLSVENVGANPRCVYIPYGLEADGDLSAYGVQTVDDGFAKSGNIFTGSKSYQLDAAARPWGWTYVDRVSRYVENGFTAQAPDELFSVGWEGSLEDIQKLYQERMEERDGFAQRMMESYSAEFGEDAGASASSQTVGGNEGVIYIVGEYFLDSEGYLTWSKAFSEDLSAQEGQWDPTGEWDRMKLPEWVREGLDPEAAALAEAVESYTDFVFEHYTQVPEELDEFLDRYRKAFELEPYMATRTPGNNYGFGLEASLLRRDNPLTMAGKIAQVFRDYYSYSLDPPQPPAGTDFVEYFLDSSHRGYCVHFATAAVMLLRSAGYPARYAEGYVVPSGEEGWTDVPDYNAHAWVEVYCAGTGWLPVEVTPPSPDAPAVYANARVPANAESTVPVPQPEELMPTLPPRDYNRRDPSEMMMPTFAPRASTAPSASPAPGSGASGRGRGASAALPAALSLAVVAAVLLLNRTLRRWIRKRALSQPDRNQAALKTYAYLLKLHKWESLCGEREDPPPRWQELAEKARYGRGMLAQEELDELAGEARRVVAKLRRQLPKFQKVRCWLMGLI